MSPWMSDTMPDLHGCEAVPLEHLVVCERGAARADLGEGLVGEADVFLVFGVLPGVVLGE